MLIGEQYHLKYIKKKKTWNKNDIGAFIFNSPTLSIREKEAFMYCFSRLCLYLKLTI